MIMNTTTNTNDLKTGTSTGKGVDTLGGSAPTREVQRSRTHSLSDVFSLLGDEQKCLNEQIVNRAFLEAREAKMQDGPAKKEIRRQIRAYEATIGDLERLIAKKSKANGVLKQVVASKAPPPPPSVPAVAPVVPQVAPNYFPRRQQELSVVINNAFPPPEKKQAEPYDDTKSTTDALNLRRQVALSRARGAVYAQQQRAAAGQAVDCDSKLINAVTPSSVQNLQLRALMAPHDLPEIPDSSPFPGIGVFLHTDMCGPYVFKTTIANEIAFQIVGPLLRGGFSDALALASVSLETAHNEILSAKKPVASGGLNYDAYSDIDHFNADSVYAIIGLTIATERVIGMLKGFVPSVEHMSLERSEFGQADGDANYNGMAHAVSIGRNHSSISKELARAALMGPVIFGALAILGAGGAAVSAIGLGITAASFVRGEGLSSAFKPVKEALKPVYLWAMSKLNLDFKAPRAVALATNYTQLVDATCCNKFVARTNQNFQPSPGPDSYPPLPFKESSHQSQSGSSLGSASSSVTAPANPVMQGGSQSSAPSSPALEHIVSSTISQTSLLPCSAEPSSKVKECQVQSLTSSSAPSSYLQACLSSPLKVRFIHGPSDNGSKDSTLENNISSSDVKTDTKEAESISIKSLKPTSSRKEKLSWYQELALAAKEMRSLWSQGLSAQQRVKTKCSQAPPSAPLPTESKAGGIGITGSSLKGQPTKNTSVPITPKETPNLVRRNVSKSTAEDATPHMKPSCWRSDLTLWNTWDLAKQWLTYSASNAKTLNFVPKSSRLRVNEKPSSELECPIQRSLIRSPPPQRTFTELYQQEECLGETSPSWSKEMIVFPGASPGLFNQFCARMPILDLVPSTNTVTRRSSTDSAPICSTPARTDVIDPPQLCDVFVSSSSQSPNYDLNSTNST